MKWPYKMKSYEMKMEISFFITFTLRRGSSKLYSALILWKIFHAICQIIPTIYLKRSTGIFDSSFFICRNDCIHAMAKALYRLEIAQWRSFIHRKCNYISCAVMIIIYGIADASNRASNNWPAWRKLALIMRQRSMAGGAEGSTGYTGNSVKWYEA